MGIINKKNKEKNKSNKYAKRNLSKIETITNTIESIKIDQNIDEEIYKKEIEIKNEDEDKMIEIINIIELKNQIKRIVDDKKNKKMKGILITKKINDKNHLYDKCIVKVIN